MSDVRELVRTFCGDNFSELPRRLPDEVHIVVGDKDAFLSLAEKLFKQDNGKSPLWEPLTLAGTASGRPESSAPANLTLVGRPTSRSGTDQSDRLLIIEHPLDPAEPIPFSSFYRFSPRLAAMAVDLVELVGLEPDVVEAVPPVDNRRLELGLPPLGIMRTDRDRERLATTVADLNQQRRQRDKAGLVVRPGETIPRGLIRLVVGPIHGDIFGAGRYVILLDGEQIQDAFLDIGYTYRGLERSMTSSSLRAAVSSAARADGRSGVAHATAYCQAVRSLAGIRISPAAQAFEALEAELERILGHMFVVATTLRETPLQQDATALEAWTDDTYCLLWDNPRSSLAGMLDAVRVGGLTAWAIPRLKQHLDQVRVMFLPIAEKFLRRAGPAVLRWQFRQRVAGVGKLDLEQAVTYGAVGPTFRASCTDDRERALMSDLRLARPYGIYSDPVEGSRFSGIIERTIGRRAGESRMISLLSEDCTGDVLARILMRLAEIESSIDLVRELTRFLENEDPSTMHQDTRRVDAALGAIPVGTLGVGFTEGFRGPVVYIVTKGPGLAPGRCKILDPSVLLWQVTRLAAVNEVLGNFPMINKSIGANFYAG